MSEFVHIFMSIFTSATLLHVVFFSDIMHFRYMHIFGNVEAQVRGAGGV